jgi:hypothetical protein
MWQVATIQIIISPSHLAVLLYSSAKLTRTQFIRLISDASPLAVGLAIYRDLVRNGFVSHVLSFDAKDPHYQNYQEYIVHVLGKILFSNFGHWCEKNYFCYVNAMDRGK